MRKEIVIAIIFGLLVGLAITFGIYQLNHRNQEETQNQSMTDRIVLDPINLNSKNATVAALISITNPENESVQENKKVELQGETFPNQTVVLFVNDNDYLLQTNDQGTFNLEIELESGSNIISAHVINPETEETEETQITVIYTNKSLEEKLVSDQEVKDAAQNGTTSEKTDKKE